MIIWVMYNNSKYDMIKDIYLDELIGQKRIEKFYRSDGWVKIGVDPVRGAGGSGYHGPERRRKIDSLRENQPTL